MATEEKELESATENLIVLPEKPPFDLDYIAGALNLIPIGGDRAISPQSIAVIEIVANDEPEYLEPFAVEITTHAGHSIELTFEEMAEFESKIKDAVKIQKEMMARAQGARAAAEYQAALDSGLIQPGDKFGRRKH
jgi:hypothetical protein